MFCFLFYCSSELRMRKSGYDSSDNHSTCSSGNQRKRGLARFSLGRLLYSSPLLARRIRAASGHSKSPKYGGKTYHVVCSIIETIVHSDIYTSPAMEHLSPASGLLSMVNLWSLYFCTSSSSSLDDINSSLL